MRADGDGDGRTWRSNINFSFLRSFGDVPRLPRFWIIFSCLGALTGFAARAGAWERDPLLSALLIQEMATDAVGFRWIATDEGVFRYDGYETVALPDMQRSGPSLPVETINSLVVDGAGRVWFGSSIGLYRFEPTTGRLRVIPLPLPSRESRIVHKLLCHPRTGRVWVQLAHAVLIIDPDRPDSPRVAGARVPVVVKCITPEAGGGVWLSDVNGGHYQLAADGTVNRTFSLNARLYPVPNTYPVRLIGSGTLLARTDDGQVRELLRWPTDGGQYDPFSPYLTDSTADFVRNGHWVHLTGIRDPHPRVRPAPTDRRPDFPNARSISDLHLDAHGTWWCFSAQWRGCYKHRDVRQVVEQVPFPPETTIRSGRAIGRFPDGRLLVSTYGGLFTQGVDSPAAPLRRAPLWEWLDSIKRPAGGVYYDQLVLRDRSCVLLAEEAWGFRCLDWRTNRVIDGLTYKNEMVRARCLLEDRAGRIWGGAQPGLFQLDPRRRQLTRYGDDLPGWPLHPLDVNDLAEDPVNHAFWLATNGGLFWFRPADRQLRRFTRAGPARQRLPTDALITVLSAGPGRVWIGTRDQGLLLCDRQKGVIRHLTVADGLPSHTIASLLLDRQQNLWAGTYAGLVRYTPTTGRLAVYREAEGLADAELNRGSAFADADGALWFGGVGGIYRVRPDQAVLTPAHAAPRLLATGVGRRAGAAEHIMRLAGRVGELTLAAGPEAYLELRLALTDFFAPEQSRYAYRLRTPAGEVLSAWLATPHNLVLRGFSPGDYQVEIRAETAPGRPAANTLLVPLRVAAHWYQWPAVWALAAVLLIAVGYGTYWLRLRRARHRSLREAHLRSEMAANLHDEVGALLTRVNMLAEMLRDQQPAPTAAALAAGRPDPRGTFDRLLANSRAAVLTMRDVVWGIDARADTVGALIDRMRDHLEQSAAAAGIVGVLTHDGLVATDSIAAPVRQHLYLIFKEAVTNAVRHGLNVNQIRVRLVRAAGQLALEITDDGQTRPGARVGTDGMGLRNMTHRAALIGAELYVGARHDGRPGYHVRVRVQE